ncbi:MAG: TetR/AcrR family transcriptional regulator [Chloroflexota bacterium]
MAEEPLSKGERTAQAIVQAAYQLFIDQGYHGTSMRQIANAAGVALGGIYNHFDSKEQIFEAVLLAKHPYHQVLPALAALPDLSAEQFIREAARAFFAELTGRPDAIKLIFIELSEFRSRHAGLLFGAISPHFLPLIERFVHTPGGLRELPSQAVLLGFVGMLFSTYLGQIAGKLDDDAFEHQLDIFLHGVLSPEAQA